MLCSLQTIHRTSFQTCNAYHKKLKIVDTLQEPLSWLLESLFLIISLLSVVCNARDPINNLLHGFPYWENETCLEVVMNWVLSSINLFQLKMRGFILLHVWNISRKLFQRGSWWAPGQGAWSNCVRLICLINGWFQRASWCSSSSKSWKNRVTFGFLFDSSAPTMKRLPHALSYQRFFKFGPHLHFVTGTKVKAMALGYHEQ